MKVGLAICLMLAMVSASAQSSAKVEECAFSNSYFADEEREVLYNLEYGTAINSKGNTETLRLDLYRPKSAYDEMERRPLIVYVHGGSLLGGNKDLEGPVWFGNELSRRGFITACINYRKGWDKLDGNCQGDTLSLELARYRADQDVRAALRYLYENAATLRIDTKMVILSGFSVGATVAFTAALAEQADYPAYLYEALGPVDSSGNTFYNHLPEIQALVGKSVAIDQPQLLARKPLPALMAHGTCDNIVDYIEAPLFSCYTPIRYRQYYGARYLADLLQIAGTPYHLVTNEGADHSAINDTLMVELTADFATDLVCGTLEKKELYQFNNGGCLISDAATLDLLVVPNPVQGTLTVKITAASPRIFDMVIYDVTGRKVFETVVAFEPPVANIGIPVGQYITTSGVYFLHVSANELNNTYPFYKE